MAVHSSTSRVASGPGSRKQCSPSVRTTPSPIRAVRAECARRKLPIPHVDVVSTSVVKGIGIFAKLALTFAVDVTGPLLLGRNRMLGGGLLRTSGP